MFFFNNIKSCNLNSAFETVHWAFNSGTREFIRLFEHQTNGGALEVKCVIIVVVRRKAYNTVISLFLQRTQ